jgi:hypothetical protein
MPKQRKPVGYGYAHRGAAYCAVLRRQGRTPALYGTCTTAKAAKALACSLWKAAHDEA